VDKALLVRDRGTVAQRHLAELLLEKPGDFVIVERGIVRSFVLACPDGCGEVLTINLDPRTDKAWRFYKKRNQVSLFPSVWRDTGCESHFIVWHQKILWCGFPDRHSIGLSSDELALRKRVTAACTDTWQHFTQLAEQLDEVPWDINQVCIAMARTGILIQGTQKLGGYFRLNR
jgi:hypothetical protein